MGQLKCQFQVVGAVQTNCYFLYDTDSKECVIVDPGDEAERLIGFIDSHGLTPVAILLTHGHFDHIMAVLPLKNQYHIPVYAAKAEQEVLADSSLNLGMQMGAMNLSVEADQWLEDGQEIALLGEQVRCILTPGHTVGGMCYYFPNAMMLFSGDTLFQESVGRTDFPGGSMSQLIRSIREKIFALPDAVQVYPGHGLMTSVKNEKMFNPFAVE